MTTPQLLLRLPALLLALASAPASASAYALDAGYHYDRPAPRPAAVTGHKFDPLPTVLPLPPVPSLPPLPTPRSTSRVHTQSLVQTHPPSRNAFQAPLATPTASAASAVGPLPQVSQIAQSYRPPSAAQPQPQPQPTPLAFGTRFSVAPTAAAAQLPTGPTATALSYSPLAPSGFNDPPSGPATGSGPAPVGLTGPSGPADPAPPQPLRIPFGKQAIITPVAGPAASSAGNANGGYYDANGRQVKQYAVIEIIDNDIEMARMMPFLGSGYFDSARAQIGASGTGASAGGLQLDSRANALLQEQQRLTIQPPSTAGRTPSSDPISLGSGGLGYIRLPNGNVYLGSGSLGYISDQQRSQLVRDARTRSGAPVPDALHFGHGPHGGSLNGFRF